MPSYRARAEIQWRKPASDDDRRANPPRNSNPTEVIRAGSMFDPAEIGLTEKQVEDMAKAGKLSAIGDQGENLDTDQTMAALARAAAQSVGPAPVPTTTERDQKTGGAAPQTPGGRGPGNTSLPAGGATRAPMAGEKPEPNVSGPGPAGAPTPGNR